MGLSYVVSNCRAGKIVLTVPKVSMCNRGLHVGGSAMRSCAATTLTDLIDVAWRKFDVASTWCQDGANVISCREKIDFFDDEKIEKAKNLKKKKNFG